MVGWMGRQTDKMKLTNAMTLQTLREVMTTDTPKKQPKI